MVSSKSESRISYLRKPHIHRVSKKNIHSYYWL